MLLPLIEVRVDRNVNHLTGLRLIRMLRKIIVRDSTLRRDLMGERTEQDRTREANRNACRLYGACTD